MGFIMAGVCHGQSLLFKPFVVWRSIRPITNVPNIPSKRKRPVCRSLQFCLRSRFGLPPCPRSGWMIPIPACQRRDGHAQEVCWPSRIGEEDSETGSALQPCARIPWQTRRFGQSDPVGWPRCVTVLQPVGTRPVRVAVSGGRQACHWRCSALLLLGFAFGFVAWRLIHTRWNAGRACVEPEKSRQTRAGTQYVSSEDASMLRSQFETYDRARSLV